MTCIVMLGIGGMDADLLRVYGPSLPNLRRMMLHSPFLEMQSCFPPEPAPAWVSIYTGQHPANHGIIERVDYLVENKGQTGNQEQNRKPPIEQGWLPENSHRWLSSPNANMKLTHEETFWERASKAGKRVCIVNPFPLYEPQPVNGVMLTLSNDEEQGALILPPDATPSDGFPPLLDNIVISKERQLEEFCCTLHTRTAQQAAAALELFCREPWDLFFAQFDALDLVQHVLWRYSDPNDPAYPGRNEYASRILDFYRLFDETLGRFRACMSEDAVLVVISGHGHGRRCLYHLNLNEWLREQGWLVPRTYNSLRLFKRRSLTERTKNSSLELRAYLQSHAYISRSVRSKPNRKLLRRSTHTIDTAASQAQVVELAGTSPFGGIELRRDLRDYEPVRDTILRGLKQLSVRGVPVVSWAKRREDVYQGRFIERYPDILFELRGDFGVSSSLYVPPVTTDTLHSMLSAGHTRCGVFMLEQLPAQFDILDGIQEPTVMDVAPTILELLGVPFETGDGKSLAQRRRVRQLI
ncbi:MAG TPA: alkaline phosphatase family protein [Ktedonobacteraceae bacterium]|nr:alkaline phosphatase family protein [Ktedonobacteraceae bacterium]